MATTDDAAPDAPWYAGVTRYQWLVLAIASAGWIFDAFEGQIFNITRNQMLGDLLGASGDSGAINRWGDSLLAVFLIGGTLGGIVFGSLADKFGRKPTMAASVLFYSIFSGLTYFATELWQVAVLRFLVALGVGGEWAVAAALVAEVFPARARAHASGIFHSTSVLGTWTAAIVGLLVGSQWRYAYLIGVAPALLVFWVRSSLVEPESWRRAGESGQRMGSLPELWSDPRWRKPALGGLALAAIGLGTFWGVTVAGQDLARNRLIRDGASVEEAAAKSKFAYGVVETAGGGIGLLCFGPLAARLGRKPTFALMLICSVVIVPITCYAPRNYTQLLAILPLFGFFTLSTHAGFALYFPELFPDRLRATGTSVCFNGGRFLAAPILWISGALKDLPSVGLHAAVTLLSLLFLLGLVVLWFMPETKGRPLPE